MPQNSISKHWILTATSCVSIMLPSCISDIPKPTAGVPKVDHPKAWKQASSSQYASSTTGWLSDFNSPRLTSIVNEALRNNPNLKVTESNLRASWANTKASFSNLRPTVNTSANGSRSVSSIGQNSDTSASTSISVNASWEIDLWGAIKDNTYANKYDYESAVYNYRAARLSLAANTASVYCNLITSQKLYSLSEATVKSFEANQRITERNYKAGVPGTSSLAVQLSRSNVESAQRTKEVRRLQRDNDARNLEILLGRYPKAEINVETELPYLQKKLKTGIPSEILHRRPDILAAERNVLANAKTADATRKNLLPRLNLTASGSNNAESVSRLLSLNEFVFNVAASLSQTVFDSGSRKLSAQATLEQHKASIYNYSQISLDAFKEVEDALAENRSLIMQEAFLIKETKSSALAEKQAERDYSEGLEDVGILEVLESQRRANDARAALINIRNNRLQNRIDLYLALGGNI